jgi:hypothetical protein
MLVGALQIVLAQQGSPATGSPQDRTEWTGCVQAGSTPSAYRLNLGERSASGVAAQPAGLGEPFVQLVTEDGSTVDLSRYVGKRVRVKGRRLSKDEAQREAARRPDKQEANEAAAGTGGPTQRHFSFVRVEAVEAAAGVCR